MGDNPVEVRVLFSAWKSPVSTGLFSWARTARPWAYETRAGTRYLFSFRDSPGRQTTRRDFVSRAADRKERERLMGKVHAGQLRVSRETLTGWWERWLAARRPYLEDGSWQRPGGDLRPGGCGSAVLMSASVLSGTSRATCRADGGAAPQSREQHIRSADDLERGARALHGGRWLARDMRRRLHSHALVPRRG